MQFPRFVVVCALVLLSTRSTTLAVGETNAPSGCLKCHAGIEPIRDPESGMAKRIFALGKLRGDPAGCVVCHGGDPSATDKETAHGGDAFYPDPGSPWINDQTCGQCHPEHVATQWNSLMMTESGKIQGTAWSFGALEGYNHGWGNYDAKNPDDPQDRIGTDAYRQYMKRLKALEPGAFPDKQTTVPEAPSDLSTLHDHPEQAAFTYQRAECERCHLAVQGRHARGDYRGMGCSACHLPYSNEGFYEGSDASIPKDKPGHPLVHSIQATREAKVTVHDKTYSGIPIETCTTCHNRGKRIGVSYQGLMESAYGSPFTEGGGGQIALHAKHYIAMQQDVHYTKGMMCQDCHTSIDVHGDGFLTGTNLAQVEIECSDCHGTPDRYPWELPIGFMDEYRDLPIEGPPRGVATEVLSRDKQGTVYPPQDGYLITARGNPYTNVVRKGDEVVVHTVGGKDLTIKPLKLLKKLNMLSTEGRVAMCEVDKHVRTMECYACHAMWAPQCYGCHVKVDYSGGKKSFDWVAAGHKHAEKGHLTDPTEQGYGTELAGHSTEQRSYLRWEDPALGMNGEGRVSPVTPGCQTTVTVIGPNGETILKNHIFRTPGGLEGSGPEGQLAIDSSPTNPHTIGKPRSCESCHMSEKALGYGIDGGRLTRPWNKGAVVDLRSPSGEVLTDHAEFQVEPIPNLEADWSRFVTEDGKQMHTVGHHFSRSGPLSNEQRANMNRRGLCLACHQEIPTQSLAVSLLHHVAQYSDALPKNADEHSRLAHKTLLTAAWTQVGGAGVVVLLLQSLVVYAVSRRMRKKTMAAEKRSGASDSET